MNARDYIQLTEAGMLSISYLGDNLDMNAIAVIQLNLQAIAEKVAAEIIGDNVVEDPRTAYSPGIKGRFEYTLNPTIRLVPKEIRIGSLFEYATPFVSILLNPDIRAALQGVMGNIIFSVAQSSYGNYFSTKTKEEILETPPTQVDVGSNVAAIVVALAQHGPQAFTIRHTGADGSYTEVEIKPNPNKDI